MGGIVAQAQQFCEEEVQLAPQAEEAQGQPGTFLALMELMDRTYDDLSMLRKLCTFERDTWGPLLTHLGPTEYAKVVHKIGLALDRPRAAEFLAKQLEGGLTVRHITQCLLNESVSGESQNAQLVCRLAPLCNDLATRPEARAELEYCLTEWERILTASTLDAACNVVA